MDEHQTPTLSKKKKVVRDGVFRAELNEFLAKVLKENGFAGVEVRMTPVKTTVVIRATRPREVLGDSGRNIRELASLVQKRFGFRQGQVELLTERVENRGLSAMAQAESLRYKLFRGLPVRRACYGVLRNVMESGANGCEVIVSGKIRAQRAKTMKFRDGYMIAKGHPADLYLEQAVRTVLMRQGVLGVKVKIMLPHDRAGVNGPRTPLPDTVVVSEPKQVSSSNIVNANANKQYVTNYSEAKAAATEQAAPAADAGAEPTEAEAVQA